MRKQTALLAVLARSPPAPPGRGCRAPRAGSAVLEVRGAVKGGPFALGAAHLAALPRRTRARRGSGHRAARALGGTSLAALVLERVELTEGADTVLVRTADRQAVPIPLTLVRQLPPGPGGPRRRRAARERGAGVAHLEQRGLASRSARAALVGARRGGARAGQLAAHLRPRSPRPRARPDGRGSARSVFGARCIACHRLRERGRRARPGPHPPGGAHVGGGVPGAPGAPPGLAGARAGVRGGLARQVWAFLRAVESVADGSAPPDEPPPESGRRQAASPGPDRASGSSAVRL